VRKGMDLHQPVMKPGGGLERREAAMFGPVARIAEKHAELDGNIERIDADVLLRQPERSCPPPNVPEKAPVQLAHERLRQNVGLPASGEPGEAARDVGLFELIELA